METFNNITLHLGDCMNVLSQLPDKSFDLAIVDPPYFSGPERRQFYGNKVSSIGVSRIYAKSEKWQVPSSEYFDELRRVARNYIVWGCNYFDYVFAHGRIVWDKCNGLRLHIAAMAMQGILGNADRMKSYEQIAMSEPYEDLPAVVARKAVRYANALIAESEKGGRNEKV